MPMKARNIDESENEIDFSDKNLSSLEEIPRICKFVRHLVRFGLLLGVLNRLSLSLSLHSLLQ